CDGLVTRDVLGRPHEGRLHLVRGDVRGPLHHQCGRTGHDRGGLRRSRSAEEASADHGTRVRLIDLRAGVAQPDDRLAGRDDVGTESSFFNGVPFVSAAPTAITYGSSAGSFSVSEPYPELPAETTTTMPLRQATSAA